MVELISKVSKGSKMDQIYIPKKRTNFEIGRYVLIKPLDGIIKEKAEEKLFFYNVHRLEPIKVWAIESIFSTIDKLVQGYENVIVTGSFIDKGFNFNDIDVILVTSRKVDVQYIQSKLGESIGIKFHIIVLDNKSLAKGLNTDPLYQTMLDKCVTKKRFIYRVRQKINYKLLDLHLLRSELLIENFDELTGDEKYTLVRNLIAINLFIHKKKVNKGVIDKKINKIFGKDSVKKIKQNMLERNKFLKKYKFIYNKTFEEIMEGVKHGSEQK